MNKIINKKNIIILSLVIVLSLIIVKIYGTFAFTNVDNISYESANKVFKLTMSDIESNSYDTVVSANDSKDLNIVVYNSEKIDLNYALYYSGISNNSGVDVAILSNSTNKASGIIESDGIYNIDIRIVNSTGIDVSVRIGVMYGYVNGGDLNFGNDKYKITKEIVDKDSNLDNSGANKPNIVSGMIPVYYDEYSKNWKKADETNMDESNKWYDYNNKMWANVVLKNNNTILDVSNNLNNGLNKGGNWDKNNGNIILNGNNFVDCGFDNYYFGSVMSLVLRFKIDDVNSGHRLIGNWSDNVGGGIEISSINSKYVLNGNFYFSNVNDRVVVSSDTEVVSNKWYTVVLTYDSKVLENNFNLYLDGKLVGSSSGAGDILASPDSIKIGGNGNVTVSNALILDDVVSKDMMSADNYFDSIVSSNKVLMNYNFMDGDDIPNGTVIGDDEKSGTLGFFTWIPRFKYKVWNIEKKSGVVTYINDNGEEYDPYNRGINIVFEKGNETTGTVKCSYVVNNSLDGSFVSDEDNNSMLSQTCNGNNGDYYTHPAFNFNGNKMGFWISKFEISGSLERPLSLPNVISLGGKLQDNFNSSLNVTKDNLYGVVNKNLTSHLIKNMEWGAVAYLTNSLYGLCDGYVCDDLILNNSGEFYTGRGMNGQLVSSGDSINKFGSFTYLGNEIDNSNGDILDKAIANSLASTTGNSYGVYDMAGGRDEYVMGIMVDNKGKINDEFGFLNNLNNYYYDVYSYGSDGISEYAYNRSMLGDASGEILLSLGVNNGIWNNHFGNFINNNFNVFVRGGDATNLINAGLFSFNAVSNSGDDKYGYRIVIS